MKKTLITLRPFVHKDMPQIGIYFDYDDVVKTYIRQL